MVLDTHHTLDNQAPSLGLKYITFSTSVKNKWKNMHMLVRDAFFDYLVAQPLSFPAAPPLLSPPQ